MKHTWIGILPVNEDGAILFGEDKKGIWGILGGGQEEGESDLTTATRELKEEAKYEIRDTSKLELVYRGKPENNDQYCIVYKTKSSNLKEYLGTGIDKDIVNTDYLSVERIEEIRVKKLFNFKDISILDQINLEEIIAKAYIQV